MELPSETPIERSPLPRTEVVGVYNLMVLVRQWKDGGTSARAANLPLQEVRTDTVREALSGLLPTLEKLSLTALLAMLTCRGSLLHSNQKSARAVSWFLYICSRKYL